MLRISPPKLSMLIANISVRTETRLPLEGNCSTGAASCRVEAGAAEDGAGTALALKPPDFPIGVTIVGVPAGTAGGTLCFCHASHKKRPDAENTTIAIILCVSMLSRKSVKLRGEMQQEGDSRNGIVAALAPRMTAQQSPGRQDAAFGSSVFMERSQSEVGTSRHKSALQSEIRA